MTEDRRRFPAPWTVEETPGGFAVVDANGVRVARVYFRDDLHAYRFGQFREHLTSDEARRIARAIARLPELLKPRAKGPLQA